MHPLVLVGTSWAVRERGRAAHAGGVLV